VVLELALGASASWAVAAALRRDLPSPLLGLGTTGLAEHRERALALGCAAFLVKPVPPTELLRHVRRLLALAPAPEDG
jgi:DNA-binding response OmpR family regulator